MKKPTFLIILDGFGYSSERKYNAIALAKKPTFDFFYRHFPHTLLEASGKAVGLPENCPGNSEAGHATLGAGKVVVQPITMLDDAVKSGEIFVHTSLKAALQKLKNEQKKLHIMGLISEAGIHSFGSHISTFFRVAMHEVLEKIYVHAFLDGRDSPIRSGLHYLENLKKTVGKAYLASLCGRFYAMDRDENWERTRACYRMLTIPSYPPFESYAHAIEYYYAHGITDEFIPPTLLKKDGIIQEGDGVIFINVRPDRARQLTRYFVTQKSDHLVDDVPLSFFITPVSYGSDLPTQILYITPQVTRGLKERLAARKKTIFSIAETEKYAQITYFFDNGHEQPFAGETRVLIPSLKEKTYVSHPCMSAPAITDAVITSLEKDPRDFYLINYANADMVGHSGNLKATIKAVECLDHELSRLYKKVVQQMRGTLFITADHGNAEMKYDSTLQQVSTQHTSNPVPFFFISQDTHNKKDMSLPLKTLADVASFILNYVGER